MYLKSLEIQGFKSFANKIDFKFHNGITGIVGPNGSGKSNVGDAVRWVLGEQSARQLRGSNMQDVIFSGTENRKPLGFASVSITLDNADHKLPVDYEEVTVSRRVYRSGESEYRLNGTSCRLKDIQEIFYDTGIGKEGYSIIGQGQIEKILSGRPEDRRELFDEAAGIVKFKRRKAAAVKKLEDERANLVRVNDILSELQRQLVPLQHQAEQAKIYLKKKEELKKIDLHLFLLEMEQRKAELANLDEKRKIAEEQLSDIKKEYETIRIHYETEEKAIEELEERIEQIREQERQSQLLHQQLTGQIEVLKEQIRAQEDQEVRLKERKSVIESELSRKEKQRKAEEQALKLAEQEKMKQEETQQEEEKKQDEEKTVETAATVTQHFDKSSAVWPSEGDVLLDYSMDSTIYFPTLEQYRCNPAMVISGNVNDKVFAMATGKITDIQENEETGCTVIQDLGDGYAAVYGQLKELNFAKGDTPEAGQVLGYVSEPTKYYTTEGSNVYFQLKKDGKAVDPKEYLPQMAMDTLD